jgi:hypothetical protein
VLNLPEASQVSQRALPCYLILSKNPKPGAENLIHQADIISLTDDNYEFIIEYNLDFEVIGKVEIYKNIK